MIELVPLNEEKTRAFSLSLVWNISGIVLGAFDLIFITTCK